MLIWIILSALALLAALLLCAYITYRMAFYHKASPKEQPLGFDSEEMARLRESIVALKEELAAIPYEEVRIVARDGKMLFGRYYHVRDGAPLQIEFHGYKGDAFRDFSGGNKIAREAGHNALLVDQRAHGKSEGRTISFGIKERYDCLSWAEYAAERFGENVPIILAGVSMGAATVLMAAALPLPKNVIAIVADSSYSSPAAIIKRVTANRGYPVSLAFPVIRLGALLFGGFRLLEADPVRAVKEAKVPILLIHGEADHFVPPSMSEEIARANESIAFYTFPDASHGASYLIDRKRYTQITADFIEKPLADFYKHLAQDIDLK